jgi:hypothetical protein
MRRFVDRANFPLWFPAGWDQEFGKTDHHLVALQGAEVIGWATFSRAPERWWFGPVAVLAAVEMTKCNVMFLLMPWFGTAMLLYCAAWILIFRKPVSDLIAAVTLGAIFATMPFITRWCAKRCARKLPSLNNLIRWQISGSELKNSTEGQEARFVWDKIVKIHETKKGFLLFSQPRLAHWLPKKGFQNESDIELFRQIVRSKPVTYKR